MLSVMSRYLQLKRAGGHYVALCPFHSEKTPSFSVDPDRGFWYCFGCKEGGDVFKFIMKMEGMGFPEAVKKLADEVGVTLQFESGAAQQESERQRGLKLLDRAASYFSQVLLERPEGQAGREYLKKRHISRATAENFRLGYAPGNSEPLLKLLERAGFTVDEAVNCGLLVHGSRGLRGLLDGRLIFPICDFQGRVLAMGGRALGDGLPKYINFSETFLYSKRRCLYGLNLARGQISREDRAIVVEGYLDVISMHQVGVKCCVASLGTALTAEQAQLLKRYAGQVILAYDGDSAGANAIVKGNAVLEEAGLQVMTVKLPAGEDPDSLARKGKEAVEAAFANKIGIVQFQIERQLQSIDVSTPEGKEDFLKKLLPFVERIQDPVRRDAYIRELSYYTGFSETKLHWRLRGVGSGAAPVQVPRRQRIYSESEQLLGLCTAHPDWIGELEKIISPDMIEDVELRPLFEKLWKTWSSCKGPIRIDELLEGEGSAQLQERLTEILAHDRFDSTFEDMQKLAEAIRETGLKKRLETLRLQVLQGLNNGTLTTSDDVYVEYTNLKKQLLT